MEQESTNKFSNLHPDFVGITAACPDPSRDYRGMEQFLERTKYIQIVTESQDNRSGQKRQNQSWFGGFCRFLTPPLILFILS